MAKYIVGGIGVFGKRERTIGDAFAVALDGDDVVWSSTPTKNEIGNTITTGIHLIAKRKLKVPEHRIGLVISGSGDLVIEGLTIITDQLSNAIKITDWSGSITFRDCTFIYRRRFPEEKRYHLVMSDAFLNATINFERCMASSIGIAAEKVALNMSSVGRDNKLTEMQSAVEFNVNHLEVTASSLYDLEGTAGVAELTACDLKEVVLEVEQPSTIKKCTFLQDSIVELTGDVTFDSNIFEKEARLGLVSGNDEFYNTALPKDLIVIAKDCNITFHDGTVNNADWDYDKATKFSNKRSALSGELTDETGNSESALEKLDKMIGLKEVKQLVKKYINNAKVQKARELNGLPTEAFSLHMVFSGNPGTGKTVVARLIAQALFEGGVLPTANFKEARVSDLISENVGGTAIKTEKVINEARGGVLFIDEAYGLYEKGDVQFANQAVDVIITDSENYRDDLVIILAGYDDKMKELFEKGNEGLSSRFKQWIHFDDYSFEELFNIMILQLTQLKYQLTEQNQDDLWAALGQLWDTGLAVGNGRFVRNFNEEIRMAQSSRLVETDDTSKEAMTSITKEDIDIATSKMKARGLDT